MKVSEAFPDDPEEYGVLLQEAAENASSEWEENFVGGLKVKYDRWGAEAFISDKQLSILKRIAYGEED